MKRTILTLCAGLACASTLAANAPKAEVTKWQGGCKAVFFLAFDDGCNSHLSNVIPRLNKYKLPGSFYLIPSAGWFGPNRAKWVEAVKSPYVIPANHTFDHGDMADLAAFEASIAKAQDFLKDLTPDQKWPRFISYGRPGVKTFNVTNEQEAEALKRQHIVDRPPYHGPPFYMGQTEQALKLIDDTIAAGGLEHLDFHGVGGEWLQATPEYLEAVLKKLDERRAEIWTTTPSNHHKYMTERNAAKLKVVSATPLSVKFELSCDLDTQFYDLPLTVAVNATGWKEAKATVNGKPAPVVIRDGKAMVDVLSGKVVVTKVK